MKKKGKIEYESYGLHFTGVISHCASYNTLQVTSHSSACPRAAFNMSEIPRHPWRLPTYKKNVCILPTCSVAVSLCQYYEMFSATCTETIQPLETLPMALRGKTNEAEVP